MTLQASGAMKLSQIRTELALPSSVNLGSLASRTLAGKASGMVKASDFYGKTKSPVILLAHMDGANGSQSLTDASGNYTFVTGANSQLNITTKKFGTASLYSPTSSTTLSTARTDVTSYIGDYTIEFWVYHASGCKLLGPSLRQGVRT